MTPDCPAPEGDARHSQATLPRLPVAKGAGQNEVWMKETLRQRKPHLSSPEGAARLSWATLSYIFVAQGCSTALLGNTFVHLRCPRVQRGSLGQHFRTSSSPEGAAGLPWATLSYIFVARGYSTALLGNTFVLYRRPRVQHGSLGQHFRTLSSPEGAARLSWATLSYFIVARGCSTARLSDTSARFRRPKVLGKRRKVESDKKKEEVSQKNEGDFGRVPKAGLEPARL